MISKGLLYSVKRVEEWRTCTTKETDLNDQGLRSTRERRGLLKGTKLSVCVQSQRSRVT